MFFEFTAFALRREQAGNGFIKEHLVDCLPCRFWLAFVQTLVLPPEKATWDKIELLQDIDSLWQIVADNEVAVTIK